MTIVEAIKEVFGREGQPLTSKKIYEKIVAGGLYEFSAKEPEQVVRGTIRKHCVGLDFPSASPVKYFKIVSKLGKNIKYFLRDEDNGIQESPVASDQSEKIPEEAIYEAYLEHRNSLKQQLLSTIVSSDPAFFEVLVVDLLLKMGYGGDVPNAGLVKGGSGDEGIDGVIKEDRLGLGKIYIQAKRYTSKKVGRPELQQFVGAMENIQKGVFITTSSFSDNAIEYTEKQQKNIVLIDGQTLCDLMITHRVGVSIVKEYATYKIDSDYFSES
jgi:restriction system protein